MRQEHRGVAKPAFQSGRGMGYIQDINGEEMPKMIITNEHDFSVWRDKLRTKLIQIMGDEYAKLEAVIGYNVDETPHTAKLASLYSFDQMVEEDMRNVINDAFWQISRDFAREEAA